MEERKSYRDEIAEGIIAAIEAGTAPWQKPWEAGELGTAPFNPTSGKPYHGINDIVLTMKGRADPRWMTYRQAFEAGAQVRKGEKNTTIEYWQWTDRLALKDEAGKPVLDEDGKAKYQTIRLSRPRVFYSQVFNGEQIEGLEAWVPPKASFDPLTKAEAIIAGAGVPILHDQRDRAFYRPSTDDIHVCPPAAFKGQAAYYETVLHELGHATGHQSRLGREFGPFGSEVYAREELRAEIASYMLARDMGISFDPSGHAAYAASWLHALREDRNEIFRAARDAETIKTWVMEPERRPELERARAGIEAGKTPQPAPNQEEQKKEPAMSEERSTKRIYIAVPYAERNQAKAAGAKWDKGHKSWWIPDHIDPAPFAKWMGPVQDRAPAGLAPLDEFAQALKAHGLVIDGTPLMDGKWHRVPVEGDKGQDRNGSYRAFDDGHPAGLITNFKAGSTVKWVAAGVALTDEARAQIERDRDAIAASRAAELAAAQEKAAKVAYGVWANLPAEATPANCPYLAKKGVHGYGAKVDQEGHLVVPIRDVRGKLWSVQVVRDEGKRYVSESQKAGNMHVIEASGRGTFDALADNQRGPIVIAEGYATAASIFEATRIPVVMAFDSGNLEAVARSVRKVFPGREILIAGDNDHANVHGNVGSIKAQAAAEAIGAAWTAPKFNEAEKAQGLTDFNDLGAARGKGAVHAAIKAALARTQELERGVA